MAGGKKKGQKGMVCRGSKKDKMIGTEIGPFWLWEPPVEGLVGQKTEMRGKSSGCGAIARSSSELLPRAAD